MVRRAAVGAVRRARAGRRVAPRALAPRAPVGSSSPTRSTSSRSALLLTLICGAVFLSRGAASLSLDGPTGSRRATSCPALALRSSRSCAWGYRRAPARRQRPGASSRSRAPRSLLVAGQARRLDTRQPAAPRPRRRRGAVEDPRRGAGRVQAARDDLVEQPGELAGPRASASSSRGAGGAVHEREHLVAQVAPAALGERALASMNARCSSSFSTSSSTPSPRAASVLTIGTRQPRCGASDSTPRISRTIVSVSGWSALLTTIMSGISMTPGLQRLDRVAASPASARARRCRRGR